MPRCLIHVGAPKTGTTYLQHVLWSNQQALAQRGLLVPGGMSSAHHDAALDLRGVSFGKGAQTRPVSAWQRLVDSVQGWAGDVVISSELLAWATRAQAERALASFPNHEIHIVFTARDLARQIPAVWQEEIKNRRAMSYQKFLALLDTDDEQDRGPGAIWGGQDPRLVLAAWAADVPPERVHVVTVPPSGAPSSALLERFCAVLGVDPAVLDQRDGGANVGLGPTQVELLRQVNLKLRPEFTWQSYDRMVKHGIALGPLAEGQGREKVTLPPEALPVAAARTERILTAIREAGYDVVGDLADLAVATPETVAVDSGAVGDVALDADALLQAGSATIAHLLERLEAANALLAARTGSGQEPAEDAAEESTAEPAQGPAEERGSGRAAAPGLGPARPRHDPKQPGTHTAFVFLGPPKVGLDRLQELLERNGRRLAEEGIRVAGVDARARRRAAEGLLPADFAPEPTPGQEAWEALAGEVRGTPGTWLVAHDLLAGASADAARAAVRSLAPAEVHLIVVGRGAERQLPAEWLEQLRTGSRQPFEHFLATTVTDADAEPHRTWFWHVQDVAAVLDRWAAEVPREHVHVVTVPADAAQTDTGWRRLCAVLGVDPSSTVVPDDLVTREPSPAAAEVLRNLNVALRRRPWAFSGRPRRPTAGYEQVVQGVLLDRTFATEAEGAGLALPVDLHEWAVDRAATLARALDTAGYDIVGDLADLRPGPPRFDVVQPGRVPDRQLLDTAVNAVAALSQWVATAPDWMSGRELLGHLRRRVQQRGRGRVARRVAGRVAGRVARRG